MPPLKKKVRIMEYYIIYNIHNGSYFINKSQRPNVSVRLVLRMTRGVIRQASQKHLSAVERERRATLILLLPFH